MSLHKSTVIERNGQAATEKVGGGSEEAQVEDTQGDNQHPRRHRSDREGGARRPGNGETLASPWNHSTLLGLLT